jgi:hypothetical protein
VTTSARLRRASSEAGTRTQNLPVNSRLLCQLSYLGMRPKEGTEHTVEDLEQVVALTWISNRGEGARIWVKEVS